MFKHLESNLIQIELGYFEVLMLVSLANTFAWFVIQTLQKGVYTVSGIWCHGSEDALKRLCSDIMWVPNLSKDYYQWMSC